MKKHSYLLKTRGFTLIELLVVIAIIGILSSVVLSSLNTARQKGRDAAAKSDLSGVRSQGSLFYDANAQSYGSDGTDCSNPGSLFDPAVADNVNAHIAAAEAATGATATCANTSGAYVIALPLQSGEVWCVDSLGYASSTSLALTGSPSVTSLVACQ